MVGVVSREEGKRVPGGGGSDDERERTGYGRGPLDFLRILVSCSGSLVAGGEEEGEEEAVEVEEEDEEEEEDDEETEGGGGGGGGTVVEGGGEEGDVVAGEEGYTNSAETPAKVAPPFAEATAGCTEEQRVRSLRCTS
ncbi:hypothetical protein V1477_020310 [Vespula maculifrons]|uniref:Uncharacterized protein n=1 Tax=Vespula maculifrons TaxID=7453 RepID=A0ABD2APC2_VESMC